MTKLNCEDEFKQETVNQLLSAISRKNNREILIYFEESSDPVTSLDELAKYIAENQTDRNIDSPEQIAVHLHHCELPMLAETGILEYDPRNKTVRWWGHPIVTVEEVSVE